VGARNLNLSGAPPYFAALLDCLQFRSSKIDSLGSLRDADWVRLLEFSDLAHLTLPLASTFQQSAPAWVVSRLHQNLSDNRARTDRIKTTYVELSKALSDSGTEHLVLKGFAQSPDFVASPDLRLQSDIDIYCPREHLSAACTALLGLGYQPDQTLKDFPSDHLPVMARRSGWVWRGNAYDPEMPLSLDLHFCLWNSETTRLSIEGVSEFWARRITREEYGLSFPALSLVDNVGFCALHILRDLLRGDWVLYHVYELACLLERHADDDLFWHQWMHLHDDSLRSLESIAFRLAMAWFGCKLPDAVCAQFARLSPPTERWLQCFVDSALVGMFRPTKDGLWLHLGLLESRKERVAVLYKSLLPIRIPAIGAPGQNASSSRRVRRFWPAQRHVRYAFHVVFRAAFHLKLLVPTLWRGLRLWRFREKCVDAWS
jgi:hypothetical protein